MDEATARRLELPVSAMLADKSPEYAVFYTYGMLLWHLVGTKGNAAHREAAWAGETFSQPVARTIYDGFKVAMQHSSNAP